MIRVNCFFQAKEGEYQRALEAAIELVAKSRSHQGCVSYDAFESATRADVFAIVETWETRLCSTHTWPHPSLPSMWASYRNAAS